MRELTNSTGGRQYWEGITDGDTGRQLVLTNGGAQIAVQAIGTFGGTVTLQGTIDGTNWFTLLTGPGGSEVTFAAAGYAEISTAVYAVRPSGGAGVGDVDVHIRAVL